MEQNFVREIKGNFNLRSRKSKKPTMIFFVVSLSGKQYKLSTQVKVYPEQWNSKKQECYTSYRLSELDNRNNIIANEKLLAIKEQFLKFKLYLCEQIDEIPNSVAVLKSFIQGEMKKKSEKAIDIIQYFEGAIINDSEIDSGTRKNYLSAISALKNFFAYKKHTPTIKELATTEYFEDFKDYLRDIHKKKDGKSMARSSLNMQLQYLRTILKHAVKDKHITESDRQNIVYKKLKNLSSSDNQIFLHNDEVMRLFNYKCPNPIDEIIKDVFLLECTTGQRISDTKRLDESTSTDKYGITQINLVQKKTGKAIRCCLVFDIARQILEKYNYEIPPFSKSTAPNAIADMMNRHIREIAKNAGISGEWLTSKHYGGDLKPTVETKPRYDSIHTHTGRHTFISLLVLRGWSPAEIARYSGHKTTEQVEKYAASVKDVDFQRFKKQLKDFPEEIVKTIEEVENDTTGQMPPNVDTKKGTILNGVFGYDKLMELHDLLQHHISVSGRPQTEECRQILLSTKNLSKAVEYSKGKDLSELKKKVIELDNAIRALTRTCSDLDIYKTYEYKMLKLGLIKEEEVTPEDFLEQVISDCQ